MGKFEKFLVMFVGIWFLGNAGLDIYDGQLEFIRSNAVIERSVEPGRFWGIVVAQVSIGLLALILLLPGLSISSFVKRSKKGTRRTLESQKAEVEVLIQYGKYRKALKLVDELLLMHPGDQDLLNARRRCATNR